MNRSLSRLASTAILATALAMSSAAAYAQGGGTTAPLTGLISDRTGAVLPGADVLVRNNATSAQFQAVTDANGRFVVPALNPGTYTVTVSLQGFKTLVLPDVSLTASTPASVKATLELETWPRRLSWRVPPNSCRRRRQPCNRRSSSGRSSSCPS